MGLKGFDKPALLDVPDDQGGQLTVSWRKHIYDVAGATAPVTEYDVQRYGLDWETLVVVVAAQIDSYSIVVQTGDILTVGQPEPFSQYRIVARTADPIEMYTSPPNTGYSIDNLPPAKPIASLYETPDTRLIVWTVPAIPDLGSMCIFRSTEVGLIPEEPLICPATGLFIEEDRNYYFYRVQFTDIHGNLSEFSDELHGQWPTGGNLPTPVAFSLGQNAPNPFNPQTTISFDLPKQTVVGLRIYDVSGRLVRTLLDGEVIDQGRRDATWNGRDDTGKQVAAGVYVYRIEAGEFKETKRMVLIK